jgi:hypothetical protein
MGIERITGSRIGLPIQPTLEFQRTVASVQTQKETPEERRQRLLDNKPEKGPKPNEGGGDSSNTKPCRPNKNADCDGGGGGSEPEKRSGCRKGADNC